MESRKIRKPRKFLISWLICIRLMLVKKGSRVDEDTIFSLRLIMCLKTLFIPERLCRGDVFQQQKRKLSDKLLTSREEDRKSNITTLLDLVLRFLSRHLHSSIGVGNL